MTDKMQNALNHIKTAVDVDPWAVDEIEQVFEAVDHIKETIEERIRKCEEFKDLPLYSNGMVAYKDVLVIINYYLQSGKEKPDQNDNVVEFGDEIIIDGCVGVVIGVLDDKGYKRVEVKTYDGEVFGAFAGSVKKTGRHLELTEVGEILKDT